MAIPSKAAMTYAAKIKDPRWQKKRLEVLQSSNWACESCGDATSTLHVHHKQYLKGLEPWDYSHDQLAVLCEVCHQAQHTGSDELLEIISRLPLDGPYSRQAVANIIAGYAGLHINDGILSKIYFALGAGIATSKSSIKKEIGRGW